MDFASLSRRTYSYLVCFLFLVVAAHSLIQPALSYGDSSSDANVLVAAENYKVAGYFANQLLPCFTEHYISDQSTEKKYEKCAYTHYPPLPYLLNAFLIPGHGPSHLHLSRALSLILSFAWILYLPFFFVSLGFDRNLSFLAGLLICLHPDFIAYSDGLHQFAWMKFSFIIFSFSLMSFLKRPAWRTFVFLLTAHLFNTWITFEEFIFYPALAFFLSFIFLQSWNARWNLWLGLFCTSVISLFLRLYHNFLFFGDWKATLEDMTASAGLRSHATWFQFANNFQKRWINFYFVMLVLIVVAAIIFLQSSQKREIKIKFFEELRRFSQLRWVFLSVLTASMFWWFIMKQHFMVHYHTNHLLFLPYGILTAFTCLRFIDLFANQKRAFNFILVVAILFGLKSPLLSRWVPFNPSEFNRIADQQKQFELITALGRRLKSIDQISIPDEDLNYSYYTRVNFQLRPLGKHCLPDGLKGAVVEKDDDESIVRCSKIFLSKTEFDHKIIFY